MKTSTQLKAMIRNISQEKKIKAEIIHRNFMMERFLERISLSDYKDQFILKGGMLISKMVGISNRTTMDMDVTVKGFPLTDEKIKDVILTIISIPVDDYVKMNILKLEHINEESEYPGIRVSVLATFDKTKQILKIDITTGDIITPEAVLYPYKLLLEDRSISILAYNLETILAEKLETILSRGLSNTRMRDYYDLCILNELYRVQLTRDLFLKAFTQTTKYRGNFDIISNKMDEYISLIESSDVLEKRWMLYKLKNEYASEIEWKDALEHLKEIATKLHD